jgi:hypothetical protein
MGRISPAQRISETRWVWLLAGLCGVAHLFQLAPNLEDIDSINFALGLREFDPGRHQPHPPGYPVYIALGRLSLALGRMLAPATSRTVIEAQALALWSALGAAVALVAVARVRQELARISGATADGVIWTVLLLAANALFWLSGSRPLSDMPGLGLALLAQACILAAVPGPDGADRGVRPILLGAVLAGFAIGLRTQTLWLTGPLLLAVLAVQPRGVRARRWGAGIGAGALACLLWAVPMVVASGGWGAYLTALGAQAGEDFAWVDMVYANPTAKAVTFALYRTFVLPWGVDIRAPGTAAFSRLAVQLVLLLALAGAVRLLRRSPRQLAWLAVAFVPYLVFHVLLQETTMVRYGLPAVPLVALLAVDGAAWLRRAAPLALAAVTLWAATLALPHTAAYAAHPNGAMQAVAAMGMVASAAPPAFIATHNTLTRSVQAADVPGGDLLPPRMSGNWLALADYWAGGGQEPVWFLADPRRFDLDSIDPGARTDVSRFPWPVAAFPEMGGVRPTAALWYRLRPPAWVVGDGWALSPETGGVTAVSGAGPHAQPVRAWVRRVPGGLRLMVGGRALASPAGAPPLTLAIDGRTVDTWTLGDTGTFLRFVEVPPGALVGEGPYATVTVSAVPPPGGVPVPIALTQFQAAEDSTIVWGLDEGWHDDEIEVATASRFRWSSGRATIAVRGVVGDLQVRIAIESPLRTFDGAPELTLLAGRQVLAAARPVSDVVLEARVPAAALAAAGGRLTLTTSRTFTPAERTGSPDQRRLGLKVTRIEFTPAR